MLGKYSVKKPYTVVVGIILVIVLGVISFSNMTTDLLPSMNFPYVIVYTTYIGATPEQVESEVTRPMESAFATLTDVKNISSRSSDNLALVVLEFNDTADLNTAMIEINSQITTLSADWNDSVGSPAIMKINPDMLPVSIVSVSREDMDIYELSEYVENTLIPEYESINGVASVSASGMITQEVDVTIEQDRIDVLNNAILRDIDAELADAEQQLDDAQAQISDGKSQLARKKSSVLGQIDSALGALDSGEGQLTDAIEQLTAQRAELVSQLAEVNAGIEKLEKLVNLPQSDKERLRQLEQQLGELKGKRDYWEKQLEVLEQGAGAEALRQQRAEAVANRDSLTAQRDRMNQYIQDLKNADAGSLNADIAALDADIANTQAALAAAQSELSARTAERDATQDRVNALKQAIAEREGATAAPSESPSETATADPDATETAAPAETPAQTAAPAETPEAATDAAETPAADETAGETELPSVLDVPAGRASWPFSARAEEATLEALKAQLAEAESSLTAQNTQVEAAQASVDEASASLKSLQDQRSAKQQALDDVESGNLQTRIDAAEKEVARLNLRIAALDAEIQGIDDLLSGGNTAIGAARKALEELDAAIEKIESSEEYQALKLLGDEDALNAQYAAALEGKAQLEAGIAQIDATLDKLNKGIIPGGMIDGIDEDTSLADARSQLVSARSQALSAFASAEAQLADASAQLAEARKEFEDKRDEALESAGLDGIITVDTVASILGAQNLSMPAGYVYDLSNDEYLVRVGDKFASLDELKTLKLFSIGMDSVDEVRLTDVARVEITDNSGDVFTKVDGLDGILMSIEKQSTFSTTDVADKVAQKNAELMSEIDGLNIVDMFNQGDYINIIVDSVLSNLVWGGILAILVLMLFLMDWRPTIIVAFSIPLSVVAAFVCMYFSGITLNVLSLSGLALGIGMLVDNSIVAIENIYRLHNEEHMPVLHACVEGVKQVSASLFASTLTTICVFLPVVFVTGLAHDLFVDLGLTIAFSLLASLLVAMTVVPSMAAGLIGKSKKPKENGLFIRFQRGYTAMLRGALKVKPLVLLAALALLAFTVMQVPKMGTSFMPQVNSTQMTATLNIDPDRDLSEQQDQAVALMERMMDIEGVSTTGLSAGSDMSSLMGSGNSLTYYIIVDSSAGRANAEIARDIRAAAEDMNIDLAIKTSTMDISMLTGSGISVDITGEETDTLQSIARDVAEIVRGLDGATEIDDGLESAVPEIRITVDKELASDNNLTIGQIYQFIAKKLYGKMEITQATLDGKKLSIYMIDGRNASITPDTLADLEMEVTSGDKSEMVRIGDVASIEQADGFSSISRENQQRVLSVSFQVAEGYSSNHVSADLEEKLAAYQPPEGYTVALSGENETVSSIMDDLVFMVLIAVLLIFLIMVAQFQSFKSPIIVMFTIPLAFTGGLLALMITGMDLSIVAMVGFLVLSGVIVNNGIVFVDTVNQLRIGGMSKKEALVETGRLRLRPILMTAMTTILGMFTMALGVGMGAEMMQPMAVVTIGGLSYATLMTLFIVPCLYDMINGEKMSVREIRMAQEAAGMTDSGAQDPQDPQLPRKPRGKKKRGKDEPQDPEPNAPDLSAPDPNTPDPSVPDPNVPDPNTPDAPSAQDAPAETTPKQAAQSRSSETRAPAKAAPRHAARDDSVQPAPSAQRDSEPAPKRADSSASAKPAPRHAAPAAQDTSGGGYPAPTAPYPYMPGYMPYPPQYYPYGQPNGAAPAEGQDASANGYPTPPQGMPPYPMYPYGYPYGMPVYPAPQPNAEPAQKDEAEPASRADRRRRVREKLDKR